MGDGQVCIDRYTCMCMYSWEQHGSVVVVLGSQPEGCEFESHLSFAVVSMSNSLYPTCFSVPSCWLGWQKRAEKSCAIDNANPGWTLGANTTLGALSVCSCEYLAWL